VSVLPRWRITFVVPVSSERQLEFLGSVIALHASLTRQWSDRIAVKVEEVGEENGQAP